MHAVLMLTFAFLFSLEASAKGEFTHLTATHGVPTVKFTRGLYVDTVYQTDYRGVGKHTSASVRSGVCELNPKRFTEKCSEAEFRRIQVGWTLNFPPLFDKVVIIGADRKTPMDLVVHYEPVPDGDGYRVKGSRLFDETIQPLVDVILTQEQEIAQLGEDAQTVETELSHAKAALAREQEKVTKVREEAVVKLQKLEGEAAAKDREISGLTFTLIAVVIVLFPGMFAVLIPAHSQKRKDEKENESLRENLAASFREITRLKDVAAIHEQSRVAQVLRPTQSSA